MVFNEVVEAIRRCDYTFCLIPTGRKIKDWISFLPYFIPTGLVSDDRFLEILYLFESDYSSFIQLVPQGRNMVTCELSVYPFTP